MSVEILSSTNQSHEQAMSGLTDYQGAIEAHRTAYGKEFLAFQLAQFTPDSWQIANPFEAITTRDIEIKNREFVVGQKPMNIRLTQEGDFQAKSKEGAWYEIKSRGMFQQALERVSGVKIAADNSQGVAEIQDAKAIFQKGQEKLAQEYVGRQINNLGVSKRERKATFRRVMRVMQINGQGDISFAKDTDTRVIRSDRALSDVLSRLARSNAAILTAQQERQQRLAKVGESSLYAGSALLGAITMAGASYLVKDPSILRVGAMFATTFAIAVRSHYETALEVMSNVKETKTYRVAKIKKVVADMAFAFLAGAAVEGIAETIGMENPIDHAHAHDAMGKSHENVRVIEFVSQSDTTSVTPDAPGVQTPPETTVAPIPQADTLYLNAGATQIDMQQLVSNPNWIDMKEHLGALPEWKQNLIVDWSSHMMNHGEWIAPKEWMVDGLQQIIDAPDLKTYSEVVRPGLNSLITSNISEFVQ